MIAMEPSRPSTRHGRASPLVTSSEPGSRSVLPTASRRRQHVAPPSVTETGSQEFKRADRRIESRASQATKDRDASSLPEAVTATSTPVPEPETQGLTRAEVLKAWKNQHGAKPVDTLLLLRDMLYLLQGIDGKHIRFARKTQAQKNREANPYNVDIEFTRKGEEDHLTKERRREKAREDLLLGGGVEDEDITGIAFVDDIGNAQEVSASLQATIVDLAELGMLYRRVYNFTRVAQATAGASAGVGGMTEQSLCSILQRELSEYHQLLTLLENQMKRESSDLPPVNAAAVSDSRIVKNDVVTQDSGMTFQRLALWTEESTLKMRMMSTLVGEAKGARGGALISAIHSHTLHGDPSVREFADRVLEEVSKPFFNSLQSWIFSGQLHDPFDEFFIQLNPSLSKRHANRPYEDYGMGGDGLHGETSNDPHMIWEKRYIFVKEMLPVFINEEFGRKIFITGKSINFIRFTCRDNEWTSSQAHMTAVDTALGHADIANLERTIDAAYSSASKRLLDIFFDRYKLLDHLQAMRNYILLCAGDFAELLLESLTPRLDRDASKLLRHHLASDIETAIQGSNARLEPDDVLRRLDAIIQPLKPGARGWDCFSLQYRVESPINAVLDDQAIRDYDRMFMHLWKIRRVSASLTKKWLRSTFAPRNFRTLKGFNKVWHRCQILQAEMIHFMAELQAFCQLEAIELSWQDIAEFERNRQGDLDALISAHRAYTRSIVAKALLINPRDLKDDSLHVVLNKLMDQILTFAHVLDALYTLSVAEKTRLTQLAEVERGILPASAVIGDSDQSAADLADIEKQVGDQSRSFKSRMVDLITGLKSHATYEVKFLAVRLSFNQVYVARKPKSTRPPSRAKAREA